MSEIKIKKKYLNLIDKINKSNKLYFEKSDPSLTDAEYDILKKELIYIESKYPHLKVSNSPSDKVGFKPSKNFIKSKHRQKMLSLSNVFDEDDLKNFEKKNNEFFKSLK